MKISTLEALCCPACRSDFDVTVLKKNGDTILSGFLACVVCDTAVPICKGFALFTEAKPMKEVEDKHAHLLQMENNLFAEPKRYEWFIQQKARRRSHDAYAVFQPFNESSQAFLPFVPMLRQILRPRDLILDTWCRTGWSAGLLSGLFSAQNIVSVWEGNSDTLGYRGFQYWFSQLPEDNNIEIIFHSMDRPLPFKNESISAVHALDTLHRYRQDVVIPELLRVTRPDGVVLFPHVHLSNAQPVPYFDRGGTILHGRDYKDRFEKKLQGSGRKVFVLSEPEAFQIKEPRPLTDNSDTRDYNGLVAVVPEAFEGFQLCREVMNTENIDKSFVIVNPIYTIDLSTATVRLDRNKLNGSVGRLFDRHPVYEKKLRSVMKSTLTTEECELIYWAKKAITVGAIAVRLKKSVAELAQIIRPLLESELVQLRGLPEAVVRMQYFHSDQFFLPPRDRQTLKDLFDSAVNEFADNPLIISDGDNSVFHYRDAAEVVEVITRKLARSGLKKGDRILVFSALHAEATLLFWAAMRMGIVYIPVDPNIPPMVLKNLIDRVNAKFLFCDDERLPAIGGITHPEPVLFDGDPIAEPKIQVFSTWINFNSNGPISIPVVRPEDPAVVLFTSGSTGDAKGVVLTHGALYRSGSQIAETYQWESRDILLSAGELHAMSGLRNPCIATLFSGSSFVISSSRVRSNVAALSQCVQKHKCTILNTIPSAIRQMDRFRERIGRESLSTLRYVMCTGSDLSEFLAQSFEGFYGVPILDYYGLTETCGFCIGVPLQERETAGGSLGLPVGCIAQVVDENDEILGFEQIGELRIYSENLMAGYLEDEIRTKAVLKNGWFYTGDLARIRQDNHIVMTGRKKDIIKDKFGNVVYPAEVEQCLTKHSGVADAAVVGYRASSGDEKLAAFVVSEKDPIDTTVFSEELRKHIGEEIGIHKIPYVFIFKGQLPRNSNGKPEKRLLLEELHSKTDRHNE